MALRGLVVPTPTLFDANEEIDPAANRQFADGLVRAGAEHLFALGSLGEFPSVEEPERGPLLRAVVDGLRGSADLWAGIGAPSTRRAVARARAADSIGAAVLVAVPPYYLHPSEAAIAEYYRQIARATGRPLLAYNIPAKVGYALSPDLVHRLAAEGVLAGAKDTAGSLESVKGFLTDAPTGFPVFPGDDALAGASIRAGAAGAVMGTANIVPRLAIELVRSAADPASKEWAPLQGLIDAVARAMGRGPFPSAVKFLARQLRNAPDGYRAPYGALTDAEAHDVLAELEGVSADLDRYLRVTG